MKPSLKEGRGRGEGCASPLEECRGRIRPPSPPHARPLDELIPDGHSRHRCGSGTVPNTCMVSTAPHGTPHLPQAAGGCYLELLDLVLEAPVSCHTAQVLDAPQGPCFVGLSAGPRAAFLGEAAQGHARPLQFWAGIFSKMAWRLHGRKQACCGNSLLASTNRIQVVAPGLVNRDARVYLPL